MKARRAPTAPTTQERENHENTGHAVFRSWCKHCVEARGIGEQHRAREAADEETSLPTISSDYAYLTDEGKSDTLPIIVLKDRVTKRYGASALPATGENPYSVQFFAGFVREMGWRRYMSRSDNERALIALKRAVAESMPDVDVVPKESPVGDHSANGEAENAVREVKRQIRVLHAVLEAKLGMHIPAAHPILTWLPRHAAEVMSRYRLGDDGKTAEQRRTGKRWMKTPIQFGERIHARPAVAVEPKSGLVPKMVEGRYVGHHTRTGTIWLMTREGVMKCKAFNRMTAEDRWDPAGFEELKGYPWLMKPKVARAEVPMVSGQEAVRPPIVQHVVVTQQNRPREFYVLQSDLEDYGYTEACEACTNIHLHGRSVVPHNAECRARIQMHLEESERGRARLDKWRLKSQVVSRVGSSAQDEAMGQGGDTAKPESVPEKVSKKREADVSAEVLRDHAEGDGPASSASQGPNADGTVATPAAVGASVGSPASPAETRKRPAEESPEELASRLITRDGETADDDIRVVPPVGSDGDANMASLSASKLELLRSHRDAFEARYRDAEIDISKSELDQLAVMSLELGSSELAEMPTSCGALASQYGMKPGFVASLPVGDDNLKFVHKELEDEDPYLLVGSPPCVFKSAKPNEARDEICKSHLRVACEAYKNQIARGRYFFHEQPSSCNSWGDDDVKEVMAMDGVYVVKGPICRWDVEGCDAVSGSGSGYMRKECAWMTNMPQLADALGRLRNEKKPGEEMRRRIHLIDGLAKFDRTHPPEMAHVVIEACQVAMQHDGVLSALDSYAAGPNPIQPLIDDTPWEQYWDDVNGGWLKPELCRNARREELEWVHRQKVYERRPISECIEQTGVPPISLMWLDTNKGDDEHENYRSRLVVRERRFKEKGEAGRVLPAAFLFSATPPSECIKVLGSRMVSQKVSTRGKTLVMRFWDIRRAHFYGIARRTVYVNLPEEEQDGVHCALLLKSMYGTQDASNIFQWDYTELLTGGGHCVGKSNPAVFFHAEEDCRTFVHGDDFCALGDLDAVDNLEKLLMSRYELKRVGTLGFEKDCVQELSFLNKVVRLVEDDGEVCFEVEADQRHAEIIVKEMGLESGKTADTPEVKDKDGEAESSPLLAAADTRQYRSLTMRAAYLAADRADIGNTVKNLARRMQQPRVFDQMKLKRLARYLKGKPRVVLRYRPQRAPTILRLEVPKPKELEMYVDSDNAGDKESRRSTVGQVAFLGEHAVKHLCKLLQVIGLSSGENEYYAISAGACTGLGLQSLLADWGIIVDLKVCSDASAARAFASRRGLAGKMKHIQTRFLWTQERIAAGHLELRCVKSYDNTADLLTKVLALKDIERHMHSLSQIFREGRAASAKKVLK